MVLVQPANSESQPRDEQFSAAVLSSKIQRRVATMKKKKSTKKAKLLELQLDPLQVQNSTANNNSSKAGFIRKWSRPSSDIVDERNDGNGPPAKKVNNTAAMNPEVNVDALNSLESAIMEALRNGTDSKDIYRVVSNAALKFHDRKKRFGILTCGHNVKSGRLTNREYCFILAVCAVIFSMVRILSYTQHFSTKSIGLYLLGQQHSHRAPKESKKERLKTAVSQYDNNAISEFLLNLPRFSRPVNKTEQPCPLDAYFNDLCQTRNGGTVCIFPGGILKRIRGQYSDREILGLKLLNDTRYFPETYFIDRNCSYMIQENVNMRPPSQSKNRWCANYTYYRDFYKGAFDIYNANNIIPKDLNTCCNTVVNGDKIRIIDFGKYNFDSPQEEVRFQNKKRLKDILSRVEREIELDQKYCDSI